MRRCAARPMWVATDAHADKSWPIRSSSGSPGVNAAVASPVAVNLVLSDETLLGWWHHTGRDPRLWSHSGGGSAREWCLASSATSGPVRRCAGSTRIPFSGALVAMESRARLLPAQVGRLHRVARSTLSHTLLRCSDPTPRPCATLFRRGSYHRGQRSRSCASGATTLRRRTVGGSPLQIDGNQYSHAAEFTTPTGQIYGSSAPPRASTVTEISEIEVRVGIALAKHAAQDNLRLSRNAR